VHRSTCRGSPPRTNGRPFKPQALYCQSPRKNSARQARRPAYSVLSNAPLDKSLRPNSSRLAHSTAEMFFLQKRISANSRHSRLAPLKFLAALDLGILSSLPRDPLMPAVFLCTFRMINNANRMTACRYRSIGRRTTSVLELGSI